MFVKTFSGLSPHSCNRVLPILLVCSRLYHRCTITDSFLFFITGTMCLFVDVLCCMRRYCSVFRLCSRPVLVYCRNQPAENPLLGKRHRGKCLCVVRNVEELKALYPEMTASSRIAVQLRTTDVVTMLLISCRFQLL